MYINKALTRISHEGFNLFFGTWLSDPLRSPTDFSKTLREGLATRDYRSAVTYSNSRKTPGSATASSSPITFSDPSTSGIVLENPYQTRLRYYKVRGCLNPLEMKTS